MMPMLSVFILFFLYIHVQAQPCDPYHHCLTCHGAPYNCATCPKGYYLTRRGGPFYSCRECPSQCEKCENISSCTVCHIKNHYGKDCTSVCSKGCLDLTCDALSGTCLCKENYEGGHCDYCAKGKYGYESDCTLDCPANCLRCNSDKNCTECKDGYYGSTCELSCSIGCYLNKCSKANGTCYKNKCKSNFGGINCDQCSGISFGNDCMSICPQKCISCSDESSCDKCKDGFWGNVCQQKCSYGCLTGVCLKMSGRCQGKNCRVGFVGEKCDKCTSARRGLNCSMNDKLFGKNSSAKTIRLQLCLLVTVLFSFSWITGTLF